MFRTINQKFYTIAGVLVVLFCLSYVQVAYFINQQTRMAAQGEQIIGVERDIRNLLNLFFRLRYWGRAVFTQDFPDAERHFGQIMVQMKSQLSTARTRSKGTFIPRELERVAQLLATYEQDFNQLIQLNTDHRLQRTRLDSSYQSLSSSILAVGSLNFLKPLLVAAHFQMGYVSNHQQTEYQALQVVIDSLKSKFAQANLLDERLDGYMDSYRRVLEEDFSINQRFKTIAQQFNTTSVALTELINAISGQAETLLNEEFMAAQTIRERLKFSFLMSSTLSALALLLILMIVARKIVRPVRSVARVIRDIRTGKTASRFDFTGTPKDEIVQLGLTFNDMLDMLEQKNSQLITYQKELEAKVQELAARQQEREHLIDALEVKNAELERFTYTVSHDLKSPLVTIRGFLGFLEEDAAIGDLPRMKTDMARIAEATEKMQWLLNDLLELSRIGRLMHPPEVIALEEIVREALETVSGHLNAKNVKIKIAADRQLLYGDRQRLREVFENLLDNALKYLGAQPVPEILIGARSAGDEMVYYVQDNGIGLAPPYREKIFGLFEKLDPTVEGTGVGLAIVKRVIEVHGGRIWVESKGIGHGSTFCFTLPAKLGSDAQQTVYPVVA
ncbi:ATP-binding protein [Desulfosarcina sp.]|uniref:sensor histidine kinase n=1 Tax=Desulfosarcina sp. TaxID=2027861 RepID=UPI00356701CC